MSWVHTFDSEPIHIFSEIGEDGYESRKVEQFADGRIGFTDGKHSQNGSELSPQPFPALSDLNGIDEWERLYSVEITQAEFEQVWLQSFVKT